MAKNKKIVLIVLISLGVLGLFIYSLQTTYKNEGASVSENIKTTKTILEINGTKYEAEISEQTSVYDFMVKLRDEGKINFKSKTYSGIGELIEEINGLKNDKNKYWIYSVNGKEAQVGVSDYKINEGDVISWKYGNN